MSSGSGAGGGQTGGGHPRRQPADFKFVLEAALAEARRVLEDELSGRELTAQTKR
jgi:hypothetical protein